MRSIRPHVLAPERSPRRAGVGRIIFAFVVAFLLLVPGVAGLASPSNSAFSKTETIARTHVVNGVDQVVDTRSFKVSVDITTDLRDRQEINVTWAGAHPTGGLVGDQNSGLAAEQEYPVVVMECRGVDRASARASQQLSPETCWTHTPAERSQYDATFNFPSYRLDRYATASDRAPTVGVPSSLPSDCAPYGSGIQHWIPFLAADRTLYRGGPFGCAGMAPEAVNVESSLQPSNTTYGASDLNGRGSVKFAIATAESNASLGCSDKVACSLVIIPIEGISCDPAATGLPPEDQPTPQDVQDEAFARCSASGRYKPGEFSPGTVNQEDLAVSGELWWSASNWRDRISVPLTFAPPANICNLVNSSAPVYIYGSELMAQATEQWAPAFCLNPKLFKLQHVLTSEPEAKNLLEVGSIKAALQGSPPQTPFTRPVVQAPAALTAFAISYVIDDATGHQYHRLKLTPRLLAKLLTESYGSTPAIQGEDPALSNNPLDLAHDPEFLALNPGGPPPGYNTQPAATLFTVSSDSDVMWSLTSYINADPEARAWLNGAPDPWGMVVNPHYKNIRLPVDGWPQLDTFQSGPAYNVSNNPCLAANPVPYLPLVAAPVSAMSTVTLNMQFGIANSQVICSHPGDADQKLVAIGPESPGKRFLLGVTPLADAIRYQLDTASLQTRVTSTAPAKFTDAVGRTFVGPNDASLRAAAALLKPDASLGTWPIPYATLRTVKGAAAYPGTMLISADVPTSGLNKLDAQRYARFLRFVANQGQTAGLGNGQLPPGYLPMTMTNGLGTEAQYTVAAASAVAAQSGIALSVTDFRSTALDGSSQTSGPAGHASAPGLGLPVSRAPRIIGISAPLVKAQPLSPTLTPGTSLGLGAGFAGLAFPLVLLLAGCGALAMSFTWLLGRWRVAR